MFTRCRLAVRAGVAVALATLAGAPLATAQGDPPAPHPRVRVGLALGGGSARGFAHIGVLEWLAERRIPIDAVAGTSIGGLVAGFYATGMTPAEIRALVGGADWDLMLSADSPFDYKTIRRKQDRRAYPALLEFGLRNGLSLPAGLNPGQRITLMFDRVALPYVGLDSFDDLPTPYRCVAFDINRAETVVLDRGGLSQAMRATMAIPGIFSPVAVGDRLLIDGGVLDNVPADVVRRMNVDVVIAVDIGRDPAADKEVTAFSILSRTVDAVMASGVRKSLESADVVLTPDPKDLTSTDWRRHDEWRARGYLAAAAAQDTLLRYAVAPDAYVAYLAARRARRRVEVPVPRSVTVTGVPATEQQAIRRELAGHLGRPVDTARLTEDILRVTGTDRYESLTYRVDPGPAGPNLVVGVRPKSNGPPFLSLGIELNNVDASNFSASVAGRTTMYGAAGPGSELRLDFVVGTRLGASGELYRPLGATPLFVAPRLAVVRGSRNRFADDRLVAEYAFTRAGVGFDIGYNSTRRTELRLGLDVGRAGERVRVGSPTLPEADGAERLASLQFTFDGQDNAVIPTRGVSARGRLRRFFATPRRLDRPEAAGQEDDPQRFWQADAEATSFHALADRDRVFLRGAAGTSFGAVPFFNDFSLGGPFRMSAFRNDELRGAHYALASVGYVRDVGRLPALVGGHAYLAAWLETGSAFRTRAEAAWRSDVAAGIVLDSFIGPVFVGGGIGPGGHRRLYIALGPLFR